jgi:hypothetical protein
MRTAASLVVLVLAMFVSAVDVAAANDDGARSVVGIRVVSDAGEVHGTAMLVRREDASAGAVLYFLTSARLFRAPDGDRQRVSKTIELRLDETRTLNVRREDAFFAGNGLVDVAVLRATAADAPPLQPRPIVFNPPPVGTVFLLSGIDDTGGVKTVAKHVRFESTLLVVGDRDASDLVGCVGAPAIAPDGVFGIVRECEAHRPPVISLLSMVQSFLERYVPRQTTQVLTPQFGLGERQVTRPLLLVGCDFTNIREVDVPLQLGPREFVTDATATLVNPREVRLTDITVLELEDRSVRLRFSLGSLPGPPAPPTDCPQG